MTKINKIYMPRGVFSPYNKNTRIIEIETEESKINKIIEFLETLK